MSDEIQKALDDLQSPFGQKRHLAIQRLAQLRATKVLVALLRGRDYVIAMWAARALGQVADPQSLPDLIDAASGDDAVVAEEATTALGMIGDKRAVPALLEILRSDKWHRVLDERQNYVQHMDIGYSSVKQAEVLYELLGCVGSLRVAAARALVRIEDIHAIPALVEALDDRHPADIGEAVAKMLEEFQQPEASAEVLIWRTRKLNSQE